MRGKIETTIPQREYENLKSTYYFESEEEKNEAIKLALGDCVSYHNYLPKYLSPDKNTENKEQDKEDTKADKSLKIISRNTTNGIDWRLRRKNGKEIWEYWDKSQNPPKWVSK